MPGNNYSLRELEAILVRAQEYSVSGKNGFTDSDVSAIANQLTLSEDREEQSTLLRILGYIGNGSYRSVVEPFLVGADPDLARTALWVLCNYWSLTSLYIEQVRMFLHGVPWDDLGECQTAAFNIAISYVRESGDSILFRELVLIYEDPQVDDETRFLAYNALQSIVGYQNESSVELMKRAKSHLVMMESKSK